MAGKLAHILDIQIFPSWVKLSEAGLDMGENITIGDETVRVYPIQLIATGQPVWFCPAQGCRRHFNNRHGLQPYEHLSSLRGHLTSNHPLGPVPSSFMLPVPHVHHDDEEAQSTVRRISAGAESARVEPELVRPVTSRPAFVGGTP
jgi:hypothetical protein